jgi:hypothetical protein
VKQVAAWLGHADPAFTLRTYVHLMDDGPGDADFLDRRDPLSATRPATTYPTTPYDQSQDDARPEGSAS